MADVIVKNALGKDITYDAETVQLYTPDGNLESFARGVRVSKSIKPNFADGDMTVLADEGTLITEVTVVKPATLIPENIVEGVSIGGVEGELVELIGVEYTVSMYDFSAGDEVITPNSSSLTSHANGFTKVTLQRPDNLLPENIAQGVKICGIVGSLIAGTEPIDYENSSATEIGAHNFNGMISLRSVTFTKATTINPAAFKGCIGLQSATFPEVTDIVAPTGSFFQVIGLGAFNGCTGLTELSLPKAVNIGVYTFNSCDALETLSLPSAITVLSVPPNVKYVSLPAATTICTFYGKDYLETIYIPSVTALSNTYQFAQCSNLRVVDTAAVETIGADGGAAVFVDCVALEALILRNSVVATLLTDSDFSGSAIENGTGYIYVPSALIEDYKTADNWSTYASQFRAIEDYPDICG